MYVRASKESRAPVLHGEVTRRRGGGVTALALPQHWRLKRQAHVNTCLVYTGPVGITFVLLVFCGMVRYSGGGPGLLVTNFMLWCN